MSTTKHISNNQKLYKEKIIDWFRLQYLNTKIELSRINCNDEFILKEKEKWIKKVKKVNAKKLADSYFFYHKNWNKKYYAWWDVNLGEVIIKKYNEK